MATGDASPRRLVLRRTEAVVTNVHTLQLPDGVGYVKIDHFSQRTVENLGPRLERLLRAGGLRNGLVLDLRGNTGGSMPEAARSADLFVDEGQTAVFTVSLAGADGSAVSVDYATQDDTARAGEDYDARSGSLSFSGSTTERQIQVPVLQDSDVEPAESPARALPGCLLVVAVVAVVITALVAVVLALVRSTSRASEARSSSR